MQGEGDKRVMARLQAQVIGAARGTRSQGSGVKETADANTATGKQTRTGGLYETKSSLEQGKIDFG